MRKIVCLMLVTGFWSTFVIGQTTIQGKIRTEDGQPAAGASILVKGSWQFALADTAGHFSIQSRQPLPVVLYITLVGYGGLEVEVNESNHLGLSVQLVNNQILGNIVVTSRRRRESAQDIPIPISVVGGSAIDESGSFNVNRVKELVPTVQLYSSNPRNTTLNIRGIGSTFGLTNDGIDPGVGFYVDGVYYARPAATTLDFIDIDQIEVLRGPQGTLFGKNTTAGAFNITTRAPRFTAGAHVEVSYGNYGFVQAKTSITGPLGKKWAGRLSFSGTQRDGVLTDVNTQKGINDLNNLGVRGQLLFKPSEKTNITFVGDASRQRPNGYAQVVAGVAPTLRAGYRQFEQIIADLNYDLPSRNPFDRVIDHNTTWRSGNDLGGFSVNLDFKLGAGTLTSTSAWRYWIWDPSNDRDFTGLPVLTYSQAPSKHHQWTQELRYAGDLAKNLSGVVGVFFIGQDLKTDPYHTEESGAAQWRFSQSTTSSNWSTPGLFEGYGIRTTSRLKSFGAAAFAQIDWELIPHLHVLPGIRYNYDQKDVDYLRQTYGGLQTSDPALLALKRQVYSDQAFEANADESNFSGQFTVAYKPSSRFNAFATVSTSYKPVGVNLGGLPTANGEVLIELARIKPEYVTHTELGVKTHPNEKTTLNLVFHRTGIKDYQTNVQTAEVGVNRGYLANAERVQVLGVEVDGSYYASSHFSLTASAAFTEGKYVKFTNAPVPLEETGGPTAFKDISGQTLPGISKWAGSLGAELQSANKKLLNRFTGKLFVATDIFYRSSFSSSPSPSRYLNIEGYVLLNARAGFRASEGLSLYIWGRNILDKDYFEQLLPAAGNAGHYAGVLGDPVSYGITLRFDVGSK